MKIRLNLGDYLAANGLTAYRLVQESRGELASNTVYALAKKPSQRIDLDTVGKILETLSRLQKREVPITALLQVTAEPPMKSDPHRDALDLSGIKTLAHTGFRGAEVRSRESRGPSRD